MMVIPTDPPEVAGRKLDRHWKYVAALEVACEAAREFEGVAILKKFKGDAYIIQARMKLRRAIDALGVTS